MADGKWRGVVTDVIAAPIDKVWPLVTEFDGLHERFPQIFSSCKTIEGESNKVGSVRLLTAPLPDGKGVIEAEERLISLDDVNHTTSYIIDKISTGWTGYKATIVGTSPEDDQTSIVWSFEVDPPEGQTKEEYTSGMLSLFQSMLNIAKEKLAK